MDLRISSPDRGAPIRTGILGEIALGAICKSSQLLAYFSGDADQQTEGGMMKRKK